MRNYFFRACIIIGFLWSIISNTLTYGLSNMPFDWKFILVGGLLFGLIFYLGMVLIFGRMINYYGTARVFNLTLLNRKKAIDYYTETIRYLKDYKPKLIIRKWIKKYYLFSSYAEIGFCYDHLGDIDSAKIYFHKALRYISRKQRHKYKAFVAKRLKYSI